AHARQLQLTGEAEGAAILARGQAEARWKELLAEAYRKFDEAAILLQTLPLVPPIVREAAAPLGNIDNLTVIDPSGASKLTDTVVRTAAEGTAIAKSLLGVDLAELLDRVRIAGVELDLGEADARAGLLVDGEAQPPRQPSLLEEALALADLRLGELPIFERDIAAGHVVYSLGGFDVRLDELLGHRVV